MKIDIGPNHVLVEGQFAYRPPTISPSEWTDWWVAARQIDEADGTIAEMEHALDAAEDALAQKGALIEELELKVARLEAKIAAAREALK